MALFALEESFDASRLLALDFAKQHSAEYISRFVWTNVKENLPYFFWADLSTLHTKEGQRPDIRKSSLVMKEPKVG